MNSYLLFKSLHLIAVISWMAGLLYLPRIFVYHVENIDHKISSSIFKTMERKLFYFIMMPAMILSWIFLGLLIIFPPTRKLIFKKVSIKQKPINKKQDFINGEFEDIEDENDRKL